MLRIEGNRSTTFSPFSPHLISKFLESLDKLLLNRAYDTKIYAYVINPIRWLLVCRLRKG